MPSKDPKAMDVGGAQDKNADRTNQGKLGGTGNTAAKPQQGDSTKPTPGQGEKPQGPSTTTTTTTKQ